MFQGTREQQVFQRIQEHLRAVDPEIDLNSIALDASLSQHLGLDSLRLASLFDRIRQEHAGVNLLPWFMNAARQGGDSLEGLVAFLAKASDRQASS